MAEPTTLKELAEQLLTAITDLKTAAESDVTTARDALLGRPGDPPLVGALEQHQAVTADMAALQQSISATRRALATAPMPADVDELEHRLQQLFVDRRSKRRALLVAQRALNDAQKNLELSQDSLQRISNRYKQAQAELKRETERAEQLTAWKIAIGQEPLSSLQDEASTVLTAAEGDGNGAPEELPSGLENPQAQFAAATARIAADIPESLLTRARERRKHVDGRLGIDADILVEGEKLLAGELKQQHGEGLFDQVTAARQEFDRAESALGAYVRQAAERFKAAVSTLRRVAKTTALTDAERLRIDDLTPDDEGVLDSEKARDAACLAVADARAALEKKRLEVLSDDIDADFDAADGVVELQTAVTNAQTALDDAQNAYTADQRVALEDWEAAIPDSTWEALADFERTKEILQELKDTDPLKLVSDLGDAESSLIETLLSLAKRTRELAFLQDEVDRRRSSQAFDGETRRAWLLSAIRGEEEEVVKED